MAWVTNNLQVEEGLGDSSPWFTMLYPCSKTDCDFDSAPDFWAHAHLFMYTMFTVFLLLGCARNYDIIFHIYT